MIKLGCYISLFFTLASCVIEDDIPYPVVDGAILSNGLERTDKVPRLRSIIRIVR